MEKSALHWMFEPLRKYATFSGRARRKEYWWFSLFSFLVTMLLLVGDVGMMGPEAVAAQGAGPLLALGALALFLPSLAVTVRRLHDHERSGWFILIGILPIIGALVLFVWYVQRGTIGDNRYGPDPLAAQP